MFNHSIINYFTHKLIAASLLICLVAGCSEDSALAPSHQEPTEQGTVNVPITISLGGYGEDEPSQVPSAKDTRTAPPGAGTSTPAGSNTSDDNGYEETKSINTIRIIAFKRKTETYPDGTSTTANKADDEDFVYDPKNDMTLTELTDEDGHQDDFIEGASHKHRVAKGTFAKSYGYEYRIVALAYDSEEAVPYPLHTNFKVIGNYTKLNVGEGKTFKDFCATFERDTTTTKAESKLNTNWEAYLISNGLVTHNTANLSANLVSIPQLFYGQCYLKDDDTKNPIISYNSVDEDGNITTSNPIVGTLYRGMAEVVVNIKTAGEALANPIWYCLLADNVLTGVKLTSYDDFNHGYNTVKKDYYTAYAYHSTPNKGEVITLRGYLLPGKTHLGVRVAFHLDPYARNGMLTTSDVSSSDNATGVISVDVANNIFYLRRNHKYVFTCNDQGTLLRKHEIK